MPAELKLEMADVIPEEIYDKIVTNEETLDPLELKELLIKKGHPIVKMFWKDGEPQSLNLPLPGEDWPEE